MKNFKIFLIILLLLLTSKIMMDKFKPERVDLVVDAPIGRIISKDLSSLYVNNYSVEYSMKDNDFDLVMAQGNFQMFSDVKVLEGGKNYFNSDDNEVIVGDDVANYYYKSNNIIGKHIHFLNKKYKVIGVMKNSKKVLIPYEERLENRNWNKIVFKARSNDVTDKGTLITSVKSYLRRSDVNVLRTIEYTTYMYFDTILLAFISIIYLYISLRKYLSVFMKEIGSFKERYDELLIELTIPKILKTMKFDVLYLIIVLAYIIALGVVLYLALKFFDNYGFSDFLINIINLGIFDFAKSIYESMIDRLKYGFESIEVYLLGINLLGVFMYFAIVRLVELGKKARIGIKKIKYSLDMK